MRQLLVLRGAPGSGKSTWVKDFGYSPYTISSDEIRLMFGGPVVGESGNLIISQSHDKHVWAFLFARLEERMSRGEFICVDACHSKESDLHRYEKLLDKYRYRMTVVDFSDVSEEVCQRRNKVRGHRTVPPEVITKMCTRLKEKLPPKYRVLSPREAAHLTFDPICLDAWKQIVVVGDVHGCYTVLSSMLPMEDDVYYIFVGDYIDRGIENREVVEFLLEVYKKPNVLLLEGNHERWLRAWAHDEDVRSPEFRSNTAPQLEGLDKKEVRQLCRKLAQCAYFTYGGDRYLVTHGGLPKFPENLLFVPTEQMVKGVGKYETPVDITWEDNWVGVHQVHGHRNVDDLPIRASWSSFNLEGKVEFGGKLRLLLIGAKDEEGVEVSNPVFKIPEVTPSDKPFVIALRNDYRIKEKIITDSISSFNFTRDAFNRGSWSELSLKARGLFVNVKTGDIVARGYDKFFNIGENGFTWDYLEKHLTFPVLTYYKYNGYLGMLGWDKEHDSPFFCTKSVAASDFVDHFKMMFGELPAKKQTEFLTYAREGYTVTFEVVDPEFDPHIIEERRCLAPLHAIQNSEKFCIHRRFEKGLYPFRNIQELRRYVRQLEEDELIEGVVIEDAAGLMVKAKTKYYTYWKRMRSLVEKMRRGQDVNVPPDAREFMLWAKAHDDGSSIISLRKQFEASHG